MKAQPLRIWSEAPLTAPLVTVEPLEEERHHLAVRRAEPGQAIEVLDGRGRVAKGRLEANGSVSVEQITEVPPLPALVLLVGAGDRDRFLWLVEKCVELGVSRLVPVETERSRQVTNRIRDQHQSKLERRAREALKQCGGVWGLSIDPLVDLADAVAQVTEPTRWVADRQGEPPNAGPTTLGTAVAIGPEGGFTDQEIGRLGAAGFGRIRLAPRTLRFETAAAAAAAILRQHQRERND